MEQLQTSMKQSATQAIETLNKELEEVQALGATLASETDQLRERLNKAEGKLEGVEAASLSRIKSLVDTQIQSLQQTLQRLRTERGPCEVIRLAKISHSADGAG